MIIKIKNQYNEETIFEYNGQILEIKTFTGETEKREKVHLLEFKCNNTDNSNVRILLELKQ